MPALNESSYRCVKRGIERDVEKPNSLEWNCVAVGYLLGIHHHRAEFDNAEGVIAPHASLRDVVYWESFTEPDCERGSNQRWYPDRCSQNANSEIEHSLFHAESLICPSVD